MRKRDYLWVAFIAMMAGNFGSSVSRWMPALSADEAVLKKPAIEVRELRIVNAEGKVVAEMGTIPEAPGSLIFRDSSGVIRCGIGFASDGSSGIELFNEKAVSTCGFGINAAGDTGFLFRNNNGNACLSIGVASSGVSGLEFFGPEKKSLGGFGLSDSGEFGIKLNDAKGNTRFDLGLTAQGDAGFKILDESGNSIVSQPE